jgi:hypothetical protein
MRCFAALSAVLSDAAASASGLAGSAGPAGPGQSIRLPGILTMVAHRAHFASAEPVYKRWRARQDGQQVTRWAGTDRGVKPVAAFVAEAKIAAFWPYREGAVKIADAFDMTLIEFALAYLRVLASWAGDQPLLAACHPTGPPPCVAEDMTVLAGRLACAGGPAPDQARPVGAAPGPDSGTAVRSITSHGSPPAPPGPASADVTAAGGLAGSAARGVADRAARLVAVAADVVASVLANPGIAPGDTADAAGGVVRALLAEPADSVADRLTYSVAEITERIAADASVIGAAQAVRLLAAVRRLDAVLTGIIGGDR